VVGSLGNEALRMVPLEKMMQINLHQLRAFYLTVKHKSITKAASILCVTQPAVSIQIKTLESFLGTKLAIKYGKTMSLTPPGKTLYRHAEKIFPLVEEMESAMAGYSHLTQGVLTIGTTRSFAKYLMPGMLSRFQERYPTVKITLGEGSSQQIADAVLSYKYDLGIIGRVPLRKKMKIIPFSKEEFCLVASPRHRFAKTAEISLKALEKEPIIIREDGSGSRNMALSFFKSKGIEPSVIMETGSVEFIKEYVMKGRGITFLYRPEIEVEVTKGLLKILRVEGDPIFLNTDIVLPGDVVPSPAAKAFLHLIRE
jgi:DNA-binding transcriptional LysR family regulator